MGDVGRRTISASLSSRYTFQDSQDHEVPRYGGKLAQGAHCRHCNLDRSADESLTATERTPCPACGESGLLFNQSLGGSLGTSSSLSTSLLPRAQDRDWLVRWQQLEGRVDRFSATRLDARSANAIHSATQDLFEFFISAYHLKDALIKDGAVPSQTVESAITASPTLALLADLANLDKHRKFDPKHRPRSDGLPKVGRVADCSDGDGWQLIVPIESNGRTIDGPLFAKQVVEEWRVHLTKWGLIQAAN